MADGKRHTSQSRGKAASQTSPEKKSESSRSVAWYVINRNEVDTSKLPSEICQWLEDAYIQGKSNVIYQLEKTGPKYTACLGKENKLSVNNGPYVQLERVEEDRIVQLKVEADIAKNRASDSAQLPHTPNKNESHPNTMVLQTSVQTSKSTADADSINDVTNKFGGMTLAEDTSKMTSDNSSAEYARALGSKVSDVKSNKNLTLSKKKTSQSKDQPQSYQEINSITNSLQHSEKTTNASTTAESKADAITPTVLQNQSCSSESKRRKLPSSNDASGKCFYTESQPTGPEAVVSSPGVAVENLSVSCLKPGAVPKETESHKSPEVEKEQQENRALSTEQPLEGIPVWGKEDIEIVSYTDGTILFPSKDAHIEESNLIQILLTEEFTWSKLYQSALTENNIPFLIQRKRENEQGVQFQSTDTDGATYRQKMKQLIHESGLKVHKVDYSSEGKHILKSPFPSVIKANLVTIYRSDKGNDLYFIGLTQKVNTALKEYGLAYLDNHAFPFEESVELPEAECRTLACLNFSECLQADQKSIIFQLFPKERKLVCAANSVFEIETAIKRMYGFLAKVVKEELDISSYRKCLLQENQTQMYVQQKLEKAKIACILDCSLGIVKVTCASEENVKKAKDVIRHCITETETMSEKKTELEKLKELYEGKVKIFDETENNCLIIVCTYDVSDALLRNGIDTLNPFYSLSPHERDFLCKHCAEDLQKIQNEYNVEITVQADGLKLQSNSRLNTKEVEKAIRKLLPRSTSVICVDQEAHDFVSSEEGKTCIAQLANDNKAICTLLNAEDAEEDACDNVLCRWYCGSKGQEILLVQGRAADLNVDCLVIPVNGSIIPLAPAEHGIEESDDDAVKHEVGDHIMDKGRHHQYSEWWIGEHRGKLKCGAKLYLPVEGDKGFIGQNDLREQLIDIFVKVAGLQYQSIGVPVELFDGQKHTSYASLLLTAVVEATIMFLSKEGNSLSSVYLCTCEKQTIDSRIQIIERKFQEMKDSRFTFFLKKAKKMMKGKKDDLKCSVHVGKLHEEKVDVLVNTVAKNLDLQNGYVSKSILQAAGLEIQDELKKNYPNGIQSMEIVVTGSYQLRKNGCHCIFHLALEELSSNILEKMNTLKVLTLMCLEKADEKGMSSIAFPALGTGKLEYPYRDVAWAMFEAVDEFNHTKQNLKEVKFILHGQDMKTMEAFRLEEWRRKHLSRQKTKRRRVPDTIKGYLESKQRLDFEISVQSDVVKTSKVVEVEFKIKKENSSGSRLKYHSAYTLGSSKKCCNDAYEVGITDDKTSLGLGVQDCLADALDKRVSHLMFHLSEDMRNMAASDQCKHIIDTIIQAEHRYVHHVDIGVTSQAMFENIQISLQAEKESRATKSWYKSLPRTLTLVLFSKEVKWAFCQSQEKKSKQLTIQLLSDTQDHLQSAEQVIRKKLKAVKESGDPLIIPSVFEKGTAQLNTAVYRSMKERDFLQEWIKSVEDQHGFHCEEKEHVVKITGQVEKLLCCQEWVQKALDTKCLQIEMDEDEYIFLFETEFVTKYIGLIETQSYSGPEMIITCKREKCDEIQKAFDEHLQSLRKNEKHEIKFETSHEISKVREYLKNLDVNCFVKKDDSGFVVVMWATYEEHIKQKNKLLTELGLRGTTKDSRKNRKYKAEEVRFPTEKETNASDKANLMEDSQLGAAFETEEGLIIRVYEGDITKLDVDCIVNAANEHLSNGAGVAKAIEDAAGRKYKEECATSIKVYGLLKEGDVRASTGGDLNCKEIFNAVGPRWDAYADKTNCQTVLRETIKKCLKNSNGRRHKTIALPSISAGIFGVPLEKCTQEYCQAIISFSKETPRELRHLEEVHFVDIIQRTVDVIQRAFSDLLRKCLTGAPLSHNSPSSLDKMTSSLPLPTNQTMAVSDSAVSRSFTSLANTSSIQQGELLNHQYKAGQDMKKSVLQNTAHQGKTKHSGSSVLNMGKTGQKQEIIRIQAVAGNEMEIVITPQETEKPDTSTQFETQQSAFLLKMSSQSITTQFPFFTALGGQLKIYAACVDITAVSVDAIVSTEDPCLSGKGAIARAIRQVAGDGFDRNELKRAHSDTPLELCSVVATHVRNLPCKFILHTVSPHWGKQAVKDTQKFEAYLSLAVCNILKTAEERKLESVAIPLLGSSDHEETKPTPVPTCARGMITGLLNFLKLEPQRNITRVEFVSKNPGIVKVFFDTLHQHSDQAIAGKGLESTESGLKNKNGEFGSDEMSASAILI